MAQKYGFFNSVNNDRVYDASDVAGFLSKFFTNGVFNNTLAVSSNDNMTVSVATGNANINGYGYENTEALTLDIDDADSTLNRIDSVILRLDLTNRQITVQVLQGDSATTPSQPSIVRTGSIYDLRLANILVSAGTTRITTDLITDTRFGSECGNVTQAVLSLDTSEIFAQYKQAFEDWFEELQVELDGDVATHLENQIISLEGNVGDLSDLKTTNKSDLVEAINELSVRKNIITAYLNEDYVIPTNDTYVGIPFDNSESMGTGLTLSDGGVVIGSGISKVKILPSSINYISVFSNNQIF